jgi:hypothetical protein
MSQNVTLVCGFSERNNSSLRAIRTTLWWLGLSTSLSQEMFAWLPRSSPSHADRVVS